MKETLLTLILNVASRVAQWAERRLLQRQVHWVHEHTILRATRRK